MKSDTTLLTVVFAIIIASSLNVMFVISRTSESHEEQKAMRTLHENFLLNNLHCEETQLVAAISNQYAKVYKCD